MLIKVIASLGVLTTLNRSLSSIQNLARLLHPQDV